MKKKILSMLICVVMILSVIMVPVNAATSGTCGDNLTWTLDDDGTLAISGTGVIEYRAFYGMTEIKSVIIGKGVTNIGNQAFCDCSSLTSITIPDSVTSIGEHAFSDCSSLTSVTIPDSVTSIGRHAFAWCYSLTSVTISDSVISIGWGVFYACKSLTSITIPDSVTSIGEIAFACCDSLTSIIIPDSVTSVDYNAFSDCDSLTSITIPDSVTSIAYNAFFGCYSLTSITVDENSVYYSSVDGNLFNKDKTELVQYAVGKTDNEYIIPDSVMRIDGYAFGGCSSLTNITIPDSVTSIGRYAFENTAFYNNTDNWVDGVLYIGNHLIKAEDGVSGEYSIKDGTKTIADEAFYGCYSLTNVTIPDSVTYIGNLAFCGCSSLISITIPDSVTSVGGYAFWRCESLTNITIPDSVTSIDKGAFRECVSLAGVTIPDSVTSIGDEAFVWCSRLADVYYIGTETEWNNIVIGADNDDLTDAQIHYIPYEMKFDKTKNSININGVQGTYDIVFKNANGEIIPVEVTIGEDNSKEVSIPNAMNTTGLKVFLWKSLESMIPLADAITIN